MELDSYLTNPRITLHEWGQMKWFADEKIWQGVDVSMAMMTVYPGKTSESHYHGNCHEVIHVLQGEVNQAVGENVIHLTKGDTCVIPPNTRHCSENKQNSEAILLLSYSEGERNYEII